MPCRRASRAPSPESAPPDWSPAGRARSQQREQDVERRGDHGGAAPREAAGTRSAAGGPPGGHMMASGPDPVCPGSYWPPSGGGSGGRSGLSAQPERSRRPSTWRACADQRSKKGVGRGARCRRRAGRTSAARSAQAER
jgi:hypothetical protein